MKFYLKTKPLPVAQQAWTLRRHYPGKVVIRNGRLIWKGMLTGSPLGRQYFVRVQYQIRHFPQTFIVSPNLRQIADGQPLPHVYDQDRQQLCLFYPPGNEWSPDKPLYQTVLPWTEMWLYYFERWLSTNNWEGGGIHIKN